MLSENIPDELVIDILTRVPPKNLVKFTLVSKSWYSLITNPGFIKTRLKKSLDNDSNGYFLCMSTNYGQSKLCTLLCGKTLVDLARVELPFPCDFSYCTVGGAVNGLICVVDAFDGHKLYLCNLAIRKYKHIGYSSSMSRCIPANPYVVLGFGYHPETDDYKVIRIMYVANGERGVIHREAEVYRLSDDSWRQVGGIFPWTMLNQLPEALVSRNLHWVVSSPESELDELILSFDLGEEVFREIMLPNYHVAALHFYISLCAWKECLSLFAYCPFREFEGSEKCYLWVMKDYGVSDSWSMQFTIDLGGTVERLLGITRFDEILLQIRENKLILYDLENHQIKYSTGIFACPYTFYVVPLIESLLFLEGGDGVSGGESICEGNSCEGSRTSTSFKDEELS